MEQLKRAAIKYMPSNMSAAQLEPIFNMLSGLVGVEVVKIMLEATSWSAAHRAEDSSDPNAATAVSQAFAETGLKINKIMEAFKESYFAERIGSADEESLLKAFIAADFYAFHLKEEYNANLRKLQMSIAREMLNRGFTVVATKEPILFEDISELKKSCPVEFCGQAIRINSSAYIAFLNNPKNVSSMFEAVEAIALNEKEPSISVYEDGNKICEYRLQTENNEDFSGKYFLISVRLSLQGNPAVPVAQIDGFISDTPEDRKMTMNDIGYRMEGLFLSCGGENANLRREMNRGQDLPMKALKYQGYTTPSNIRLIGICPECKKSFAFHGYAFYMGQSDVAYSDDGLDCCEISAYDIDKDAWTYEEDGKTFRYYNSFNCPHCGTPYIDYKKFPENKVFGVSGCVHLGRKHYTAK